MSDELAQMLADGGVPVEAGPGKVFFPRESSVPEDAGGGPAGGANAESVALRPSREGAGDGPATRGGHKLGEPMSEELAQKLADGTGFSFEVGPGKWVGPRESSVPEDAGGGPAGGANAESVALRPSREGAGDGPRTPGASEVDRPISGDGAQPRPSKDVAGDAPPAPRTSEVDATPEAPRAKVHDVGQSQSWNVVRKEGVVDVVDVFGAGSRAYLRGPGLPRKTVDRSDGWSGLPITRINRYHPPSRLSGDELIDYVGRLYRTEKTLGMVSVDHPITPEEALGRADAQTVAQIVSVNNIRGTLPRSPRVVGLVETRGGYRPTSKSGTATDIVFLPDYGPRTIPEATPVGGGGRGGGEAGAGATAGVRGPGGGGPGGPHSGASTGDRQGPRSTPRDDPALRPPRDGPTRGPSQLEPERSEAPTAVAERPDPSTSLEDESAVTPHVETFIVDDTKSPFNVKTEEEPAVETQVDVETVPEVLFHSQAALDKLADRLLGDRPIDRIPDAVNDLVMTKVDDGVGVVGPAGSTVPARSTMDHTPADGVQPNVVRLKPADGVTDEQLGEYVRAAREALNVDRVRTHAQSDPWASWTTRVDTPHYAPVQVEGGGPMTAVEAAELGSRIGAPVVVKAGDLQGAHDEGLLTGEGPNGDSVVPMGVKEGKWAQVPAGEAKEFVYYGAAQRDGGGVVSEPVPTPLDGSGPGSPVSLFDRDGWVTVRPRPGQSDGEVAAEVERLQSTLRKSSDDGSVPVPVPVRVEGRRLTAVEALRLRGVFRAPVVVRAGDLVNGHNRGLVTGDSVVPIKVNEAGQRVEVRARAADEFVFDRASVAPDADGVVTIRRLGPGSDADVARGVREIRAEIATLAEGDRPQVRVDVGRRVSAVEALGCGGWLGRRWWCSVLIW